MLQITVKDWIGNEIKLGDTIVVILFNRHYPEIGLLMPNDRKYHITHEASNEEIWEIDSEFLIDDISTDIGCTTPILGFRTTYKDGEYTIHETRILESAFILSDMRNAIIAIKGVSDNKELYEANKNNN